MKALLLLTLVLMSFSEATYARAPYKKALGVSDCTFCHVKGDFIKKNIENPYYKKASEYADKIKNNVDGFKGKKCIDCHQGKQKPEKAA